MDTLLMVLLCAAPVPDVTAGPGLADEARVVEAPVHRVTVFSDRARVRRRASVELKAGIHTLRLTDLPGAVMMDSIRVESKGIQVLRVEAVPVERERFSIEQVEVHIEKLEKLTDEIAALDRRGQVYAVELAFLQGVSPRPPIEEAKRAGKPQPPVLVDAWRKVLGFLDERKGACRKNLRELAIERRDLSEKFAKVQREVQRHNLGAFTDRKVQVVAIVSAKSAGTHALDLEYFVPGASWKPAYNLHFDPDQARVMLKTAGMVRQASGEDWTEALLALSTAIPGQGIHLPELLTWALGEKREFIPRPRAARMPRAASRFAPPRSQPTRWEAERQAKLTLLQQRLNELQRMLSMAPDSGVLAAISEGRLAGTSLDGLSGAGIGGLGTRGAGAAAQPPRSSRRPHRARPKTKRPPPSPPPRPMPKPPPPMETESLAEEEPRPVLADSTRSRTRAVGTPLGIFEPTYYHPPRFSDPTLPAVVAGGLDYVYDSPTTVTIPSTGEHLRVPLAADRWPVEVFYEAAPALKKTAYLKAKVTNRGERPILQGPVNIFVGKDFTGQGTLKTTGSGGTVELPLGADEDIRILRKVIPETVTEGVISKDDITTYTVVIEIGNYKRRAIEIHVVDQVPKTRNEDIEIEMKKTKPKPEKGPDEDGIMRWKLRIPAGKTRTIRFAYKIERPENWQLSQ